MKRLFVLALILVCSPVFAVDLGADFPAKGFARGDALNAKFDALNDGKLDATGTANITGSLGVTGKTTTGTLESGAATFTGDIGITKANFVFRNSSGTILHNGLSSLYFGANAHFNGSSWVKFDDSKASSLFTVSRDSKSLVFSTSDTGNSNPEQNGPFNVWHGGMNAFYSLSTANAIYAPGTSDGADDRYASFCSGGAATPSRGGYVQFYGNEATGGYAGSIFLQAGNVASGNIHLRTQDTTRLVITYAGDVRCSGFSGGGTTGASLDNDGDIIRTPSDLRLKENIIDITAGLDKVRALRGVTFNWKDKASFGSRRDYGMIAQEVEAVIPEVVTQNPDGMKSLDYQKIVPVLVEAIKEQQRIIESIESRINALEGK